MAEEYKKKKTLSGKCHISNTGEYVPAKEMGPPCLVCRMNCRLKITEEQRKYIHNTYWSPDKTWDMKRQFIVSRVIERQVNRPAVNSLKKRAKTLEYSFIVENKSIPVCKNYFLRTLSISQTTIYTALKKKDNVGLVKSDKRGKNEISNKLCNLTRQSVREHIMLFPAYESHYGREKTDKKYLGPELCIKKMYSLYVKYCEDKKMECSKIDKEWL